MVEMIDNQVNKTKNAHRANPVDETNGEEKLIRAIPTKTRPKENTAVDRILICAITFFYYSEGYYTYPFQ